MPPWRAGAPDLGESLAAQIAAPVDASRIGRTCPARSPRTIRRRTFLASNPLTATGCQQRPHAQGDDAVVQPAILFAWRVGRLVRLVASTGPTDEVEGGHRPHCHRLTMTADSAAIIEDRCSTCACSAARSAPPPRPPKLLFERHHRPRQHPPAPRHLPHPRPLGSILGQDADGERLSMGS